MKIPAKILQRFRERGVSLVLVLFAVAALSFLVVLYFSLAANDRSSTAAFTNAMKAEALGTGGLELVIEELRKEITDGTHSTATVDPLGLGPTVYTPADRKYILPEQTGTDAWGNLIKYSSASKPLYTGSGGQVLASNFSSTIPSRNGRAMTAERWNKPALAQFATGATLPDWIYIGRKGPVVNPSVTQAADKTSPNFVLGRIAFNVYDISGLLDLNVAGYPAEMAAIDAERKGSAALAKLQAIGLTNAQVEALIAFRNPSSRGNYVNYLKDTKDHAGFTKTLSGDNRFLSRQELLRFAKLNGFTDQLRYFTVFSREKNAPTYKPSNISATNPDLSVARHTNTGRLLFEQRFPLEKIDIFAAPGNFATDLKNYFGLTYDATSRSFTYVGSGSDSHIKTLSEIASESNYRVPNFFETLKAVIFAGSIGQSAGATLASTDDSDKDHHILQIGANIIDQYDLDPDTDSSGNHIPLPTTITLGTTTLYGVENLPYVNMLMFLGELTPTTAFSVGDIKNQALNTAKNNQPYGFRFGAQLWNPHFQSFPTAPSYIPKVRVDSTGQTQVTMYDSYNAAPPAVNTYPGTPSNLANYGSKDFLVNHTFSGQAYSNYNYFCDPTKVGLGPAMPDLLTYDSRTMISPNDKLYHSAKMNIQTPISVTLSVFDKDGIPRVYQRTLPISGALTMSNRTDINWAAGTVARASAFVHSDPRTNRTGYLAADYNPDRTAPIPAVPDNGSLPVFPTTFVPNATPGFILRPQFGLAGDTNGYGVATTDGVPTGSSLLPKSNGLYLGMLWENASGGPTKLVDPDGVYRGGDGAFSGGLITPMKPISSQAASYNGGFNPTRPVQLDRPFRSVADLGYTYRDIPWRSLNFSGTDSADAGLLDAFSVENVASVEGKVNLNTTHPEVLQALLSGSLKEEAKATSLLSDANATATAAAIIAKTGDASVGPLQNISEFVTNLSTSDIFNSTNQGTDSSGAYSSSSIKTQRESVIRALSGSTQTRTWNFLIDLVAQSGRFPKGAANLGDFTVEGERRYWLHVAIDRYTGEVVSEMLETVNE